MCMLDWENLYFFFCFVADADYHPVHQTLVFSDDSGDRIPVNITIIKDNEQNEFYEVFLLSLTSIDIPLLSPKAVIIILDQG